MQKGANNASKGKEAGKKDDGIYAIKMARVADLNLN